MQKEYKESTKVPDPKEKDKEGANKPKLKIFTGEGFDEFNQTNYINQNCMLEFYNKYSKYDSLYRKYPMTKKTPSWAFIESSNEEKIIPNPLGLLRRRGQEKKLVITNQKVGDTYMKVLSNSLKFSHHLNNLELSGNRLSSFGTSKLFKSLNDNKELSYKLKSINLSQNKIGSSMDAEWVLNGCFC